MREIRFLKMKVYSFEQKKLTQSLHLIRLLCGYYSITHQISSYALPWKTRKFTLNRSPHIDKKSREQFKLTKGSLIINFKFDSSVKLISAIFLMKHKLMQKLAGIGLKTEFKYHTKPAPSFSTKILQKS